MAPQSALGKLKNNLKSIFHKTNVFFSKYVSDSVTILRETLNVFQSLLKEEERGIPTLYFFNPMTPKKVFDIEEYFYQRGMRIRRQKATDIFKAQILNIDLVSEIQLSILANIACSCVSAVFLDTRDAETRLT